MPAIASADDRLTIGYLASRAMAGESNSLQNTGLARWEHAWPSVEIGAGVEVAHSGGTDALTRIALLPAIALVRPVGSLQLRLEEQLGWQLVDGHVTIGGIPFAGTEPRSFHDELSAGAAARVDEGVDLRGRVGLMIDGLYPAGHSSLRAGAFIGVELAMRL